MAVRCSCSCRLLSLASSVGTARKSLDLATSCIAATRTETLGCSNADSTLSEPSRANMRTT